MYVLDVLGLSIKPEQPDFKKTLKIPTLRVRCFCFWFFVRYGALHVDEKYYFFLFLLPTNMFFRQKYVFFFLAALAYYVQTHLSSGVGIHKIRAKRYLEHVKDKVIPSIIYRAYLSTCTHSNLSIV